MTAAKRGRFLSASQCTALLRLSTSDGERTGSCGGTRAGTAAECAKWSCSSGRRGGCRRCLRFRYQSQRL